MPDLEWIAAFLLLGSIVGFMAGLLGIGGGGIMVPILSTIFIANDFPMEEVVHLALGTSMASIVVTSFSSMRAHNSKNAVLWNIVKFVAPGVILGTFFAAFATSYIKSVYLAIFFAIFMAYVSLQMILDKKPNPSRGLLGKIPLFFAGGGIGSISALVSIGGGSLSVPFLVWQNVDIKKAIGTSAAIGFPLSVAGTFGYVVSGFEYDAFVKSYMLGFVYLPAVLLISMASFFTAPLGVKAAHALPVKNLKKIFAVLSVLLSLKMLLSVI